eukprot:scaffold152462_cov22-Tisochrysis_lutea.AAC.1
MQVLELTRRRRFKRHSSPSSSSKSTRFPQSGGVITASSCCDSGGRDAVYREARPRWIVRHRAEVLGDNTRSTCRRAPGRKTCSARRSRFNSSQDL